MTLRPAAPPPKLVTRAVVASFFTVALVLGTVLVVISIDVRSRVRRSVADNLASAQEMFSSVEARRQQEVLATVATLAENPTLKAALDTWLTERHSAESADELLATVQHEGEKLAARISSDVLAVTDPEGRVIASAGPRAASWPRGARLGAISDPQATSLAIATDGQVFRVSSVTLELQDASVGSLRLGTALSDGYAHDIALLSRGEAAIILNGRVLASTLPAGKAAALASSPAIGSQSAQKVDLLGESWAGTAALPDWRGAAARARVDRSRGRARDTSRAGQPRMDRARRDEPRRAQQCLAGAHAHAARSISSRARSLRWRTTV